MLVETEKFRETQEEIPVQRAFVIQEEEGEIQIRFFPKVEKRPSKRFGDRHKQQQALMRTLPLSEKKQRLTLSNFPCLGQS